MTIDDSTARWLIGLFASAVASTLWATFRAGRQSKQLTEALDTVERLALLVEGNSKEADDQRKRNGIVGRTTSLEGIATATTSGLARLDAYLRAVLRGMGLPSDLSDPKRLQVLVAQKFKKGPPTIDREEAIAEIVDFDSRRSGHDYPALDRLETPPVQVVPRPTLRQRNTPIPREDDPPDPRFRADDTGRHKPRR